MTESREEHTPNPDHDPDDSRGGGGEGGLSGAAPGVEEEDTPGDENSPNEPKGDRSPEGE